MSRQRLGFGIIFVKSDIFSQAHILQTVQKFDLIYEEMLSCHKEQKMRTYKIKKSSHPDQNRKTLKKYIYFVPFFRCSAP